LSLTPQDFRRAWSKFPTGVSLITTRTEDGGPYCTTANAISSVSLDPLLVHLSLAKSGVTCANVQREGRFGLNMLGEDDEELAIFFSRATSEERQRVPEQHVVTERGTILLDEALTAMDCRVVQQVEAGDHIVFIAQVDEIDVRDGRPLVFYEGKFTHVGD
jgi:flavin reductase (DIM6/NTAB) family NADH-FMN oxidoreductase RutF